MKKYYSKIDFTSDTGVILTGEGDWPLSAAHNLRQNILDKIRDIEREQLFWKSLLREFDNDSQD